MNAARSRGKLFVGGFTKLFHKVRLADPSSLLVTEGYVNGLGYRLLGQNQRKEAIEVFKLNVEAYPKSANTYDSLAEACLAAGEKKLAVDFYQRALEVDPNYPNAAARRRARGVITERLMTLGLPGGRSLRLGRDLDAEFPHSLQELTNRDLRELLARLDPTPDSVRDTGAGDWADLPERLHYIVDLFRCYQESPDLLGPPFTPEQVNELAAGRMPGGRL